MSLEERARGWPAGQIKLLPIVETALGVMNVREIALADPRVDALLFGAEDLAGDMGAVRTPAGWEVFYAAQRRGHGGQSLPAAGHRPGLLRSERPGGLRGRVPALAGRWPTTARWPSTRARPRSPSASLRRRRTKSERALRIIQAHEEAQAAGLGAFALDGRMVDMPVVRMAEQVLRKAQAAGMMSDER